MNWRNNRSFNPSPTFASDGSSWPTGHPDAGGRAAEDALDAVMDAEDTLDAVMDAEDRLLEHWNRFYEPDPGYAPQGTGDVGVRASILREAEGLVNGDRNAQYGDPNQDFARTAAMWTAYVSGLVERDGDDWAIETQDVAWMMVLLKASRSTTSPNKRDHYVDAAGYIACGADCADVDGGAG